MAIFNNPTHAAREHFRHQDLDTVGSRIKKLRKLRGLTQPQLAEIVGVEPITILRWEKGQRSIGRGLDKLAAALNTDERWITYGGAGGPSTLPVMGHVGAAAEVFPFDSDTLDEIEAPFGAPPDTRALIVRGDSMMPELNDGDFVLYRDKAQRVEDLVGKRCVVRLDDGRVLVKRLRRGTTYGTFTLDSTNAAPIEDVMVIQAAKVEGVVFR
jgi:transcriptional regulator with XRE-family HTH domain